MDSITKHYIENLKGIGYNKLELKTFEQTPNSQDYQNQYIFRYFVRKRNENNGLIYEVSKDTYDIFNIDSLYFGVKIKWKIYGDKNETETANIKSVEYGKKTISNLNTYINNYLKFWKG